MAKKTKGNNQHGFQNEIELVNALNQGKDKLNKNLKQFIKYICDHEHINFEQIKIIHADYESNNKLKQDLYLYLDEYRYNISLKLGKGNSVHQEKCEDFVNYLQTIMGATKEVCDTFRFFIWGDGSLDGNGQGTSNKDAQGQILGRFSAKTFQQQFPIKRQVLLDFVNEYARELISHFLFEGRHQSRVDYIYHGTTTKGSWIDKDTILNFQLEKQNQNKACLPIGSMSLQAWNVSLKGTSEHKRGQLQVKYSNMQNDFELLLVQSDTNSANYLGDLQEHNFIQMMNKNKGHRYWKMLVNDTNYEDYYVVQVNTKQYSSLSQKRVFPKSDAYVVKTKFDYQELLLREFALTESDLKQKEYEVASNSGVSIKYKESKNYTIMKFTINSFLKVFKTYFDNEELREICLGLLIYSDEKQVHKNYEIAKRLELDYEQFLDKKKRCFDSEATNYVLLDLIRKGAQEKVSNVIKSDLDLWLSIFTGKLWFKDPYCAKYLYANKKLLLIEPSEFTITTGSGRSKQNYSIEIKAKK